MNSKKAKKQYLTDIGSWNWEGLKQNCRENATPDRDNPGQKVGTTFIGTVMALMPSGKFYAPFACSNVTPCPRCKGEGHIPNRKANLEQRAKIVEWVKTLRSYAIERYGSWADRKWSASIKKEIANLDIQVRRTAPTLTCPACDGVGSIEALQDQLFQEALEEVAESNGMFVTSSEGDACDMLVGLLCDDESEE